MKKQVRRWRLVRCFMDEIHPELKIREERARKFIANLVEDGFKAKIYAPLPQHKTSGHTHVVALCTLNEKLFIGGVFKKVGGRIKVATRDISSKRLNEFAESLREARGWLYVDERQGDLEK